MRQTWNLKRGTAPRKVVLHDVEAEGNGADRSEPARLRAASSEPRRGLIISGSDFIANFTPPDYLIDGVVRRRFAYSFTGRTGDGKTAVLLRMSAHVLRGLPIGRYDVERGRVLYLAGENPDDIRMRWIAQAHAMGFDPGMVGMHFIEGRFSIKELFERVAREASLLGGFDLVTVDTSATFFELENENDNAQMAAHARMMRTLTTLPGGPVVMVACHPTKNASDDSMTPRGGGAFLAEMDGNLTSIKHDTVAEVHHQGKFRGADFAPLSFQLVKVTAPALVDSKGRPISTVMARPIDDKVREEITGAAITDQDQIIVLMHQLPGKSIAGMAEALSWHFENREADKSRAQRTLKSLRHGGFVCMDERSGKYTLTDKGKKEAQKIMP